MLLSGFTDLWLLALSVVVAVWVDKKLGEPRRWHPLVGLGRLVSTVEKLMNPMNVSTARARLMGALALLTVMALVLVPLAWGLGQLLAVSSLLWFIGATTLLYLAIGNQSLGEHAQAVEQALSAGQLPEAREKVGYIVSRQTGDMNPVQVTKAAMESVLENGSDAVFAPLFWFVVAGPLGVVLYRIANTLDAMWGYRNQRFHYFGWAVARFDDLLNWLPARLCALTYIVISKLSLRHWFNCIRNWRLQAPLCASPNGGPVMSAGASALNVSLGGAAVYFGERMEKPVLGQGDYPEARDIGRSVDLVQRGVCSWCVLLAILAVAQLLAGLAL